MSITGNSAYVQTVYGGVAGLTTTPGLAKPFYAQPSDADPDAKLITEHLTKELKIELHNNQQLSLVEALKSPDAWLGKRETAMKKIVGELSGTYATALKHYIDAKYPYDEAVAKATRQANVLYQLKLEDLDAELPGANVLLTGAFKDRQYQGQQAALYNGNDGIDYKAKYLKRQAKKNANNVKKEIQQ